MKVQGFSHVTINVSDLQRALDFYTGVLQMRLVHRGRRDAYLEWGSAWICLQERSEYGALPSTDRLRRTAPVRARCRLAPARNGRTAREAVVKKRAILQSS